MKKKYILGNWKQNGSLELLALMAKALAQLPYLSNTQVGIFPPAIYLSDANKIFTEIPLMLGIQNISAYQDGAYTGEISATMCLSVNAQMALIGHSERRHLFGESNEICAQKFKQAQDAGLLPVFCVGETLREYENQLTEKVIREQLQGIYSWLHKPFLIAYEPVWAIGTGKASSKENAQQVHAFIRSILPEAFQRTPILYGGSVKATNAAEYLHMPDIDGVLVGGASLDPVAFSQIITSYS